MDIKHRIKHKDTKTSLVDLLFSVKLQAQRQLETFVGPTWMTQSVEKNMKMSVRRTSWDHRSRYIRSLGTGLDQKIRKEQYVHMSHGQYSLYGWWSSHP
jgi:flagellar biosynthesis chaperone FliJ